MKEEKKIRVAIIGVGNCALALINGSQYYVENPEDNVGLMYPEFGGYALGDIEYVMALDVDKRKVGKRLNEALQALPNCAMLHVPEVNNQDLCPDSAMVYSGPVLDGVADHMLELPEEVSFRLTDEEALNKSQIVALLKEHEVDVVLNYLPVGSRKAARFYVDCVLEAGCNFVNCMPTFIATEESIPLEQEFIDRDLTIIGSDMRGIFGASRLSEILHGSMLDSGLMVTQHIQENKASGCTQGQEHIKNAASPNCDFSTMADKSRLYDKWVSKENVLAGQSVIRGIDVSGMTYYAGPSLVTQQKPGGTYRGTDNKVANIDIVAYGWGGCRYELHARLSVQDSSQSAGIVITAIRACRVANEMGIVGYLRGPSAFTQKTSPLQMTSADAKFECDALSRRILTDSTTPQLKENNPVATDLPWTLQKSTNDYE